MRQLFIITLLFFAIQYKAPAQTLKFESKVFELSNVKASIVRLNGVEAVKVERDLKKLPFDTANLSHTVDEATFLKLKGITMDSGVIEVKMLSQLQNPSPFAQAQGFIGLAFRVNDDNTAFESIYLRPKAARSNNQFARNHSVQYYAYPDYKFDRLRQEEFKGQYETYADMGLNEWITMRIEFAGKTARLYLNGQQQPAFVVNDLKASTSKGAIGLWVDIGTIGYFRDLKITKR